MKDFSVRLVRRAVASAGCAAVMTGSALAHTPYILPNAFSPSYARMVTAEASFAESFFAPEFAIDSDAFHVVLPDGSRDAFDTEHHFEQLVVLEEALEMEGTYRLTTGPRAGRKFPMRRVDGVWAYLDRDENGEYVAPGAGVETAEFQTLTVAEAYVTKGPPTAPSLAVRGEGLEIHPLTHPSEVYLGEGFELEILFNGEPVPQAGLNLYRADGDYEEPHFHQTAETDAEGLATLRFDRAGVYLVMLRHRAEAPDGAETPYRSYTSSLTFEVVR